MKAAMETTQKKSTLADKLNALTNSRLEDFSLQEQVSKAIDKLLAILDKDIRHIEDSLVWLNELRSLVIKRNDADLSKLLQKIKVEADNYTANESERQLIRKKLADIFECDTEQMTLSALEDILPKEKKALITDRKIKLKELIEQLRKEHLSTALLLSDCARFNNLLFKTIFDIGKTEMVMYSPSGATKKHVDKSFVNLKF